MFPSSGDDSRSAGSETSYEELGQKLKDMRIYWLSKNRLIPYFAFYEILEGDYVLSGEPDTCI